MPHRLFLFVAVASVAVIFLSDNTYATASPISLPVYLGGGTLCTLNDVAKLHIIFDNSDVIHSHDSFEAWPGTPSQLPVRVAAMNVPVPSLILNATRENRPVFFQHCIATRESYEPHIAACADSLHRQLRAFIVKACPPPVTRTPRVSPKQCPAPRPGRRGGILIYTRTRSRDQRLLGAFSEWYLRLGAECVIVLRTRANDAAATAQGAPQETQYSSTTSPTWVLR
jgi:hypothetical protein